MDLRAIAKAESRMRIARGALRDFVGAKSHQERSDYWYVFLTASKNVWTCLEKGSKGSTRSQTWFGVKRRERIEDPLLQYLFHARNDDEHGLEEVTAFEPGGLAIGVGKPGNSVFMKVNFELQKSAAAFEVTPLDGKPVVSQFRLGQTILKPVTDLRNRTTYSPPTSHMGEPLNDERPFIVGELGLVYLAGLIDEARELS